MSSTNKADVSFFLTRKLRSGYRSVVLAPVMELNMKSALWCHYYVDEAPSSTSVLHPTLLLENHS